MTRITGLFGYTHKDWCKCCMFIMLPCSQRANIWEISALLPRPGCSHGVSVLCMCVQISSLYAANWPALPSCIQLILVSWYVARKLCCSVWVMLCRCKVIPLKYGSFVSVAVQKTYLFSADLFFYMKSVVWLTLWICWLHSCRMFILLVEYGLVHRGDCINCETCYFSFDPAFKWRLACNPFPGLCACTRTGRWCASIVAIS